eukprot:CAMPEP_0177699166 /NCGR_PEP_ID=MMETSP0484_2-20121128/5441_1 /TAXON_ID=354590 /ORGANISM="Rhodomonas lens, Strain RHODO" /LENGTH=185 /DNA_ID=CAMNT_0019210331 /DNA_START=243 /DNA_END=795 /DNA_ORIENTATION=+
MTSPAAVWLAVFLRAATVELCAVFARIRVAVAWVCALGRGEANRSFKILVWHAVHGPPHPAVSAAAWSSGDEIAHILNFKLVEPAALANAVRATQRTVPDQARCSQPVFTQPHCFFPVHQTPPNFPQFSTSLLKFFQRDHNLHLCWVAHPIIIIPLPDRLRGCHNLVSVATGISMFLNELALTCT